MQKYFWKTSIIIGVFSAIHVRYKQIEQRLIHVYCDSQLKKLIDRCRRNTEIYFKYSFLGRISGIKPMKPMILENSRLMQQLATCYEWCRKKVACYLKPSGVVNLAKAVKEEICSSPVKAISIVLVTLIMTNTVLSIVFERQIGLWGWLASGLFLFIGLCGLFFAHSPRLRRGSGSIEKEPRPL